MQNKTFLSVSDANLIIKTHLEAIGEIFIQGEIKEINISQNKWVFLTICDENSCINVFSTVFRLTFLSVLKKGIVVRVYGTPTIHLKSSRFSINAYKIEPVKQGLIELNKKILIEKLRKQGFFDKSRKRTLPFFPEKIVLLTAKKSRAYSDFIKILSDRIGGIKIFFIPISVQGKQAVDTIVNAFSFINLNFKDIDAVVLTRGGGSKLDLEVFDNEEVAKAIFSSKFPVISAIGHEADISIADMVSDVRASTPSNAAEILTPTRGDLLKLLENKLFVICSKIENFLNKNKKILISDIYLFLRFFDSFFLKYKYDVQKILDLAIKIQNYLKDKKQDLYRLNILDIEKTVLSKKKDIDILFERLKKYDVNFYLNKGFCLVKSKNGYIKSIESLNINDQIDILFKDGKVLSKVLKKIKKGR